MSGYQRPLAGDFLFDQAMRFHDEGPHQAALRTVEKFLGDWHLVDRLGRRLGHKSLMDELAKDAVSASPLWVHLMRSRK